MTRFKHFDSGIPKSIFFFSVLVEQVPEFRDPVMSDARDVICWRPVDLVILEFEIRASLADDVKRD